MILFGKLGLAEKSEINLLKILFSKIEYDDENEGLSFIDISSYSIDATK